MIYCSRFSSFSRIRFRSHKSNLLIAIRLYWYAWIIRISVAYMHGLVSLSAKGFGTVLFCSGTALFSSGIVLYSSDTVLYSSRTVSVLYG